jgi:hypothetical protein
LLALSCYKYNRDMILRPLLLQSDAQSCIPGGI